MSLRTLLLLNRRPWLGALAASAFAHLGLLTALGPEAGDRAEKKPPVKVRITESPIKKPEPKPKPKKVAVKKKKKKLPNRPKKKPTPNLRKSAPKKPPSKLPEPIQGLSKDSFAKRDDQAKSIAAPRGNTLFAEDKGIRKDEVEAYQVDLSSRAKRIKIEVPALTDDALDAGLEGKFTVDVFINTSGIVEEAELSRKIGYGMDQRLIDAALNATYQPKKDKLGRSISGWDRIVFHLVIPE